MKIWYQSLFVVVLLILAGCGGGGTVVHVVDPAPVNYTPELLSFDLYDSYDVDTRVDHQTPLALNPYYYEGLFDVFWRVNSLEDYRVELRINDSPSPAASYLLHAERCGVGLWCDQSGNLLCEYTSHFSLSCEGEPLVDVSPLFPNLPQELFLILQVCDLNSSYCEYDYYPVWME